MNKLRFDKLVKIIDRISINNLLSILIYHGTDITNIKFVPILTNSASEATILNILEEKEKVIIEVNLFKVTLFSKLENLYQIYLRNNNIKAIQAMRYGAKILLYRYFFGTKNLQYLFQSNIYKRSPRHHKLSNIINSLYKLMGESYRTVINYEKQFISLDRDLSILGGSNNVGNVFLGGFSFAIIYVIKVRVIFLSNASKNNNLAKLESLIQNFEKKMDNKLFKIKLYSYVDSSKKDISYVGEHCLT